MDFTSPFNDEVIRSAASESKNPFDMFDVSPTEVEKMKSAHAKSMRELELEEKLAQANAELEKLRLANFATNYEKEIRERQNQGMVCYPTTAAVTVGDTGSFREDGLQLLNSNTTRISKSPALTAAKREAQREANQRFSAAYAKYQEKSASKGSNVKLSDAEKRVRDLQKEAFINDDWNSLKEKELTIPKWAEERSREGSTYKPFSEWSKSIPIVKAKKSEGNTTKTTKKAYKGPSATALALNDTVSMMPSLRTDPESYKGLDRSAREQSYVRYLSRK